MAVGRERGLQAALARVQLLRRLQPLPTDVPLLDPQLAVVEDEPQRVGRELRGHRLGGLDAEEMFERVARQDVNPAVVLREHVAPVGAEAQVRDVLAQRRVEPRLREDAVQRLLEARAAVADDRRLPLLELFGR